MNFEPMPEWLWRWDRLNALTFHISSRKGYDTGGEFIKSPIPNEWFIEYAEHITWLANNKPEQLITFINVNGRL